MTRAPVLAKELHNVAVKGFVEAFERREKKRVRITLRVTSLGALAPEATPYRVRVSRSEKAGKAATGDAVAVKATLRPLPEPVMPNGFDFGRTAWFARLGGTGYATGAIQPLTLDQVTPLDLRLWAAGPADGEAGAWPKLRAGLCARDPVEPDDDPDAPVPGSRGQAGR